MRTGIKHFYRREFKTLLPVLANGLVFALQTSGLVASIFFKHRGRSESMYILPVALALSSLRWWPNYVSTGKESGIRDSSVNYIKSFFGKLNL